MLLMHGEQLPTGYCWLLCFGISCDMKMRHQEKGERKREREKEGERKGDKKKREKRKKRELRSSSILMSI